MTCGVPNEDGYQVVCEDEDPRHASPHVASGERWVVVWCTPPKPCRKGLCPGPCHALNPRTVSAGS